MEGGGVTYWENVAGDKGGNGNKLTAVVLGRDETAWEAVLRTYELRSVLARILIITVPESVLWLVNWMYAPLTVQ